MEEILPTAPWESRCLQSPWSSPSHCQPPWSGRHGSLCNHLSAEALTGPRGPDPSLKGVLRAGTWGREVPPRPAVLRDGGWGSTQALAAQGHRAAAAWSRGCLPARGIPLQRVAPGGSRTMGGRRGVSKPLRPRRSRESPRTSPWCREVNGQPVERSVCPAAAERRLPPAPTATGLGLCRGPRGGHQTAA